MLTFNGVFKVLIQSFIKFDREDLLERVIFNMTLLLQGISALHQSTLVIMISL